MSQVSCFSTSQLFFLCSSLGDVFLNRNISGLEVVCPLQGADPKLVLFPGTETAKDVDTDRFN